MIDNEIHVTIIYGCNKMTPHVVHVSQSLKNEIDYLSEIIECDVMKFHVESDEKSTTELKIYEDSGFYKFTLPRQLIKKIYGKNEQLFNVSVESASCCGLNLAIFKGTDVMSMLDEIDCYVV